MGLLPLHLWQERAILLSLMADCADECVQLVRVFDTESYEVSMVHWEISTFISRLHFLFNEGNVINHGYTEVLLESLKAQRGFLDSRGNPKTLGGPGKVTAALLQRCLCRMQLFVDMAVETLRSEFPDFDIVMAFSAFDLEHSNKAKPEERLQRLSQVFEVDFDQLAQEFWDLRPLAMHEFSKGCTCCQAWVRTVQRIETRQAAVKRQHPTATIRQILLRYLKVKIAYWFCLLLGVNNFVCFWLCLPSKQFVLLI